MLDTYNETKGGVDKTMLSVILQLINFIIKNLPDMANELDKLEEEVTESKTVADSAAALLTTLAEKVRAVAGNRERTIALADQLDASNKSLATAVAANTIAEEPGTGTGTGTGEGGTGTGTGETGTGTGNGENGGV